MLNILKKISEWRKKHVPNNEHELQWTDFHLSIVGEYFSNLSTACDFPELPSAKLLINDVRCDSQIVASFTEELDELFVVPRLNEFHESVNKYQLVEAFISFLLQLLYQKPDTVVDGIGDLEKELRFLHTVVGDTSFMQCDEHEEFQKILEEFESVANEAGRLVHTVIFSASRVMDEDIGSVLNHAELLKANIMKFLNLWPSISRSVYISPKTSTVDSFLIVDSLIHDLEDMMQRRDDRIAVAKDQIEVLHQWLILLQSSVKDLGLPQPSKIVELKKRLMRIGVMAHEAEYLIISFLVGDAPSWYLINRLTDINHNIELVGTETLEITNKYRFGGSKVERYFKAQQSLQDKRIYEVSEVIVGFEEKATEILHHLVGGTEPLQVISIFGMPGLGKTTLANKLYNHPLINDWFDRQSWYAVSQIYRRQSMLANILIHINGDLEKDKILGMEEETLVLHIYKTLKGRRYLIVLDDIWDLNVWDDLHSCFPDDGNGSRILVTSRNKGVAPHSSIMYELPFLSDDQCWELLEKKVFGSGHCPPKLQQIGRKIAEKCCGLPLTVVVIAGILSTGDKEDESTWEEVGGNLASYIDEGGENSVMQIMELSYQHLPDHLKPCFLSFGVFEEDKEIPVAKLMRLWVAEGYIHKEKNKCAENIAEEYLMELIDKSLVIAAKRRSDGRGVKACVIHDLLRDLCLTRCRKENFVKHLMRNKGTLCEKSHWLRALRYSVPLSYCQHVRSFYSSKQPSPFYCPPSPFYVRDMRLLRVLHFITQVPTHQFIGIQYLVNLRYLTIWKIPPSIDNLVNLEHLHVVSHVSSVYLTPAIANMIKLRYFYAVFTKYGEDWNSSQTNNLEFLSWVTIVELKDEEMLRCSPHLRRLKCRYELRELKKAAAAYPHFDLRFLTRLESLNLTFHRYHTFVLEEFGFPQNIRKLKLSDSRLPWEKISIIGRLENLEVLELSNRAFGGETWDTRDGEFQNLRFLKLKEIYLSHWNVASSEHLPKLQHLVLSYCMNLLEIPSEIGEITTLELIEVQERCPKSLVESVESIRQEQWDMGNEELRVIISITSYSTPTRGLHAPFADLILDLDAF